MTGFIESKRAERRSLERALAGLVAKYERDRNPNLARTIGLLRAELELRKHHDQPALLFDGAAESSTVPSRVSRISQSG